MRINALLRLIAPLALAAALLGHGCGDDGAADDEESSSSSKKKDAGTIKRKDAGVKKDAAPKDEEEEDDEATDEEEEDTDEDEEKTSVRDAGKKDAEAAECTTHDECSDLEPDAGIACCDIPTGTCYVSKLSTCPSSSQTGNRPNYN